MLKLAMTEEAEKQLKTIPVLADIKRNANIGDLLTFNKSDIRPIFGIFNGFREQDGKVCIELRDGTGAQYVRPEEIATLHAGNGYAQSYRDISGQGKPAGGNSI